MYRNGLINKIRLISNFMTSQPVSETILIQILPNISRSIGNQTMKFGELIESNIRNILLEKSYTKYGGETSPRLISEKRKLSIPLDKWSKILYSLFLLYGNLRTIEIY